MIVDSYQPNEAVLYIGPNASWFRVTSGDRVSLARRHPLRRLLAAMQALHAQSSELSLDTQTAFAVGWPGERANRNAADMRVHTAIFALRSMGLRGIIRRYNRGYILDCRVQAVSNESGTPPALGTESSWNEQVA